MDGQLDWKYAPPYAHDQARLDGFEAKYHARCFCGTVVFEVCADPADSKICHCSGCQSLHGAPFQWAVIFRKSDVRFVQGVDNLYCFNSELGRPGHVLPCKLSCKTCRSPIADEGRRMFLAFGPLFDFGFPPQIPASFKPSCHLFYGARVIDVHDDKPKYMGHKGTSPLWVGDGDVAR